MEIVSKQRLWGKYCVKKGSGRLNGMDRMDWMDGSAIKLAHYKRCGMRVPGPTCITQRVNDRNASGAIHRAQKFSLARHSNTNARISTYVSGVGARFIAPKRLHNGPDRQNGRDGRECAKARAAHCLLVQGFQQLLINLIAPCFHLLHPFPCLFFLTHHELCHSQIIKAVLMIRLKR